MIAVAVALEVLNIKPQPVAMDVASAVLVDVVAMVAVVVREVRLLAVSGSSCSTRSVCGHSFRARGASAEHCSTLAIEGVIHMTRLLKRRT